MNSIRHHFEQAHRLLEQVMNDEHFLQSVHRAGEAMSKAIYSGNKIMSCGNGGSMCDAMHFAEELTGRYRDNRAPIAAISISDPSHMSCVGNDYGYQFVFSRFVEGVGRPGDVLLAISTSGNSANVVEAARMAQSKGISYFKEAFSHTRFIQLCSSGNDSASFSNGMTSETSIIRQQKD